MTLPNPLLYYHYGEFSPSPFLSSLSISSERGRGKVYAHIGPSVRPLNNTFLYGVDGHCLKGSTQPGRWASKGCTTFRGGAYDPLASKTRRPASGDGRPSDDGKDTLGNGHYPQVTEITDTLRLNDNITFQDHPIGLALNDWGPQGYLPMAAIGLGPASVLLERLKSTGSIASRSWSFFWGLSSPGTTQLDGSLIFGGYDRAKVVGKRHALPLAKSNPDCQSELVATVSDLVLNFPNGTDASLFSGASSGKLPMCITPSLPTLMRLPQDPYVLNLVDLVPGSLSTDSRSLGMYYWNLQYERGPNRYVSPLSLSVLPCKEFFPMRPRHRKDRNANRRADLHSYDGDMTIKFQTGLSIRIPNSQLVVPHTYVDQTTGIIDVNFTVPDVVIDPLQDVEAKKMAHLGWNFLSSAYVHVNQDAGEFYLWAANPTADQDLVAVDSTGKDVTSFCAGGGTTATAAPESAPPTGKRSLKAGAIAGIVIGSILGAGILGGLAFWLLRRRGVSAAEDVPPPVEENNAAPNVVGGSDWKHELQGQENGRSELEVKATTPWTQERPSPMELPG